MTDTLLENKPSSAVSLTQEDFTLMQKVKRHLSTCECCRVALKSDNISEVGHHPIPNVGTDDNTHNAEQGISEYYGESKVRS